MRLAKRISGRVAAAIPAGRSRRLAAGVVTGVLTRGAGFAMTLLIVPMTLAYLGPERYGVWVTMISFLAWFSLMDLGIANGLTPALSAAFGQRRYDLGRQYVATAISSLTCIAVLAGALIAMAWGIIDWGRLFNVQEAGLVREISVAMAVAVCLFLFQLPLAVNQRILLAYQEGQVANLSQFSVSAAGLVGVYLATRTEGGLLYLVLGYSGMQVLAALSVTVLLFMWSKLHLRPFVRPKPKEAKHVLSLGGLFFICQIGTLIIFQKDNILITHYLGPTAATPYNVVWQLFFFLNAASIVISPYLAPGFGEAFASGDKAWMRKAFWRYLSITCGIAVPAAVVLTVFHKSLLKLWVGPGVEPTISVVIWMAIWTIVLSIMNPLIAVLVGVGRLKLYAICSIIAASSSLALSILMINKIGVVAVIAASVISYVVIMIVPAFFEVRRVLEQPSKIPARGYRTS